MYGTYRFGGNVPPRYIHGCYLVETPHHSRSQIFVSHYCVTQGGVRNKLVSTLLAISTGTNLLLKSA